MISVVVVAPDSSPFGPDHDQEHLVRSLAWLVSATVAGTVRDVTVAGPAVVNCAEVADLTGCGFIEGEAEASRLRAAIALARGPWLLVLRSGYQPGDTMLGELDRLVSAANADTVARLLVTPMGFWQRLVPTAAQTVGLFASAQRFGATSGGDFDALRRSLRPKRLFAARAAPIF